MRKTSQYGWLELIEGILLIVFAVLAFTKPYETLGSFVVLYGILAMVIGIGEIVFYIHMESHIGFAPSISLISGILCVLLGCCLLAHPETGIALFMILFPIWIIFHCISRLSHLGVVHFWLGQGYYIFTMIINIIGLVLGFGMIVFPGISVWTGSIMLGVLLLMIGLDHVIFAICDFKNR